MKKYPISLAAIRAAAPVATSSVLPGPAVRSDAFAAALAHVLAFEGGWSEDPFDPGGPTNKGITLAVYARESGVAVTEATFPRLTSELRAIPDALVERIYRERYWTPSCAPDLPAPLALFHFDAAVNQGVGAAARMLQEALGVDMDGEIGPLTLAAARSTAPDAVLGRYADIRRRRYRALAHFWRFGRGWLRRVDAAHALARALAGAPSSGTSAPSAPPFPAPSQPKEIPPMTTSPEASSTDATAPGAKWWGGSLTIWGALLTGLSTVAPALFSAFGIDMPADLVHKLGRDVVTHELVYYGERAAEALRTAVPALPSRDDFKHVNGANSRDVLAEWEARLGAEIELPDSLRECLADDRSAVSTATEMVGKDRVVIIDPNE